MPEYPINQTQRSRPISTRDLNMRANADAFGASIGRGLQDAGAGIGDLSQSLQAVQNMEDKAVVEDRLNQYSDFARNRTYDPKTGYRSQLGQNAVQGRAQFEKDLEDQRKALGNGLTPSQSRMYQTSVEVRQKQALDTGIRHAANERINWMNDTSAAREKVISDDAIAMYGEPEKLALQLASGAEIIKERGLLKGWSPEQTQIATEAFQSGIHKAIVLDMATSDPIAAKQWLDDNSESMTEADRIQLEASLVSVARRAKAAAMATDTILKQNAGGGKRQDFTGHTVGDVGKGFTDFVSPDGTVVHRDGTRAFRNNNPGNIEYGPFAKSQGAIGTDGRFAVFETYAQGRKAQEHLLFKTSGYKDKTIAQAIARYAPDFENPTTGYINSVTTALGVEGSTKLSDLTAGQRVLMLDAMEKVEGFAPNGGKHQPTFFDVLSGIKDPLLRKDFMEEYVLQTRQNETVRLAAERQANINVEKWIIANPNASIADMPITLRQELGVSGMQTLVSYQDLIAKNGRIETDDEVYIKLLTLYAEYPTEFVELDLFDSVDKLSINDRRELQKYQIEIKNGQRIGEEYVPNGSKSRIMEAAIYSAKAARIFENPKQMAQFQKAALKRADEMSRPLGRDLTDAEIQQVVDEMFLRVTFENPAKSFNSETTGFLFQAANQDTGTFTTLNIELTDIDLDSRLDIIDFLTLKLGRVPTDEEIMEEYGAVMGFGLKVEDEGEE